MSVLHFIVKDYNGPGEWVLVSRLLWDGYGAGCRFKVECNGGRMWCYEFMVDGVGDGEDLVRRVRIGGSLKELTDFFVDLGFSLVLPEGVVLF